MRGPQQTLSPNPSILLVKCTGLVRVGESYTFQRSTGYLLMVSTNLAYNKVKGRVLKGYNHLKMYGLDEVPPSSNRGCTMGTWLENISALRIYNLKSNMASMRLLQRISSEPPPTLGC